MRRRGDRLLQSWTKSLFPLTHRYLVLLVLGITKDTMASLIFLPADFGTDLDQESVVLNPSVESKKSE